MYNLFQNILKYILGNQSCEIKRLGIRLAAKLYRILFSADNFIAEIKSKRVLLFEHKTIDFNIFHQLATNRKVNEITVDLHLV